MPGGVSTNNSLESLHNIIKRQYTFRRCMTIRSFLSLCRRMLSDWSKREIEECQFQPSPPSPTLATEVKAHHYLQDIANMNFIRRQFVRGSYFVRSRLAGEMRFSRWSRRFSHPSKFASFSDFTAWSPYQKTEFVPCAPVYVVSNHHQHPVIQCKSKRWDDTVLEFHYKSAGPKNLNILFYQCIACKNVANQSRLGGEKSGVAHIKLVNGVIVTDPDNPNTPHNCGAGNNTTATAEGEEFLQTYDLSLGREILVFFAISDLDMLLEAEFVLCDGNHKYNPPEFHKPGQLYTLHTIVKGECHPFLFAMMKKVDQEAYRKLFNSLRQAMVTRFGHLGNLPHSIWLFDFKPAAMGACIDVFNPLKHLRLHFAQDLLRAVPIYTSPMINAQMQGFCKYFTGYWLSMPLIRNVWGQFGNSGPRTTNYVEGWHNGLHSHMNGRHPSLAELIGLF
uniref:MULE transposase domain-containing protein n=1 Tax=Plectus sambesii TaxID=2011161 RepID=A0A914WL60_9BILA